jgi:saccharopine dehydrogenase-like NADP-dependent oxidoreductase
MAYRVLLIGATGVFGSRIARRLAPDDRFQLILAGRSRPALEALAGSLPGAPGVQVLDVHAGNLSEPLAQACPQLVIHAAGPFQAQDYRVAQACVACGCHYVDLADGRAFVTGISALDDAARAAGCLVVAGASSVPALSAAVVDAMRPRFATLDAIDSAISPGNRTPRGDATVASILGYCGQPIRVWREGAWGVVHGWMASRLLSFPFGRRLVGACDVPDLDLFPTRYPGVRTVMFRAGLELRLLHGATWCAAALVRLGLVRDLARHAVRLRRLSDRVLAWGTDVGGMVVELRGSDTAGQSLRLRWWLEAAAGDGPEVPVTPAVVIAHRLAQGNLATIGAQPCVGLLSLGEIIDGLAAFAIRTGTDDVTKD